MRFRLLPTDDKFFDLFREAAANVADGAERLRDLLADGVDLDAGHRRIVECERKGDDITKTILTRLNSTFVTPFDREDIHALAEELDDVVDDLLEVAHRIKLTSLTHPTPPELKQQADLLVQMADETVSLIDQLESMKGVRPFLDAVDRLESEGDTVYRQALARLFGGEYDALDVVRWKDIVEAMEAALNTVEDISNVVEAIVLKHA
jgi:uncharacterized protein